jgi:hypothetical protein
LGGGGEWKRPRTGSPGALGPLDGDSGSENGDAIEITQGILGISPVLVLYKAITCAKYES